MRPTFALVFFPLFPGGRATTAQFRGRVGDWTVTSSTSDERGTWFDFERHIPGPYPRRELRRVLFSTKGKLIVGCTDGNTPAATINLARKMFATGVAREVWRCKEAGDLVERARSRGVPVVMEEGEAR